MEEAACPFCGIPAERVIAQNARCVAIADGFPVSPGHALVIPKRHVATWFDASDGERRDALALLDELKAGLDATRAPGGYNIGMNCGACAGQTVMHLHVHLIPRYVGDMENPRGGVRGVIPEKRVY